MQIDRGSIEDQERVYENLINIR